MAPASLWLASEFLKGPVMAADDGWRTIEPARSATHRISAGGSGRVKLGLPDIFVLLWRAKWGMALVAAPIFALGILGALALPVKYEAASRIQVSVGSERVFNPIVGPGQGAVPEQQAITESEIELLQSPVIADRVIQQLGLARLYPKTAKAISEAPQAERPVLYERAIVGLQENFSAGAAPKNPVIRTAFKHENPEIAALTLNTIIATYLTYRAELFSNEEGTALLDQKARAENKLKDVDLALETFLTTNSIGDFETEKTSIAGIYGNVTDQLYTVEAGISEARGRLSSLNRELAMTEPTIDLFVESNDQRQLMDLRIRKEQLLATYQPDTPQVRAVEREIARVEALVDGQGSATGVIRRGPNEVYQSLETQRAQLEAEANALSDRLAELRRQKERLEARQITLTRLEPRYQELLRERALLENQVRSLSVRSEEERLNREVSETEFDNIQILEPARVPSKGSSLRKPVAVLALLFAGFTGLLAGLMWAFTRSTLPTGSSAGRSFDLPVLATVPVVKGTR